MEGKNEFGRELVVYATGRYGSVFEAEKIALIKERKGKCCFYCRFIGEKVTGLSPASIVIKHGCGSSAPGLPSRPGQPLSRRWAGQTSHRDTSPSHTFL